MNLLSSISFASSMAFIFFGIYVLGLNRRAALNRIFFSLSMAFALWTFAYSFLYIAPDRDHAFFWYRLSSVAWCSTPPLALHFVLIYTRRRRILSKRWIFPLIYAIPLPFLWKSFTGYLISRDFVRVGSLLLEVGDTPSPWYWGYLLWTFLFVFMPAILILRYRGSLTSRRLRKQALVVLVAYISPGIFIYLINVMGPILNLKLPVMGHLSYTLGIGGIAYAISRYRFMKLSLSTAGDRIITQMMDILLFLDNDLVIQKTNRQAEEILQYTEPELRGMRLSSLVKEEAYVRMLESLSTEQAMLQNEVVRLVSRSGGEIPVNVSASVIIDDFGESLGTVMVGHDIRDTLALQERNAAVEKELRLAQQIQRGIIPSMPPAVPYLAIASFYKPQTILGGDFYDFLRMPDPGMLGIFIGDVTGHGVPAALVTSMIKILLEISGELREEPGRLLEYINRTVIGQIGDNFITALYGIYDSGTRSFSFSRGGHEHPLLIRDGVCSPVSSRGRMLGVEQEITYEVTGLALRPGDKLLLYTDGLLEEINGFGENFGDQLFQEIEQRAHLPAEGLVRSIHSALQGFNGGMDFQDDVSMICIQVL
ncbi:MAG: SpoIIE family protein phosphatase [Spirochaetes bacterium]|nr:SpoIIE family protein phosphatase [Spirochaetota bacterium]